MQDSIFFPNYHDGSIVNLMSSIIIGRGGQPPLYAPLKTAQHLDSFDDAKNLVLLIIDGLGYDYLVRQGAGSAMQQHLHGSIHAVAPPTTAASISTFLTGLAPQQHGLMGWYTWFRELGSVVTVLPFLSRCNRSDLTLSGITPGALYGHRPVFDLMQDVCYSITPEWLGRSAFNRAHLGKAKLLLYERLEGLFDQISATIRCDDKRKYIYAYWPGFDALAHEHGVGSAAVSDHFARLDEAFNQLVSNLAGTETMLLLCADHGFVDVPDANQLSVNDMPELQQCLQLPLCGEPRLAYCYVRDGMQRQFVDFVRDELAHAVDVVASRDLIRQGLFGLGEPHGELSARVGDFALVMKDNYVLTQQLLGESIPQMRGFHGGLSQVEVEVPLVTVTC